MTLPSLRARLRKRRGAIPAPLRRKAARALLQRILRQGWLRAPRRIGLYLSLPEEIDTGLLLAAAARRGCRIVLPRITRYRDNRMALFDATGPLRRGRFGIAEPQNNARCPLRHLDVVFMPLVGFDSRGNRVGMGKGFYDRLLAVRRRTRSWRRPVLAGLAFDCQEVAQLTSRDHDVPLDYVVTETRLLRCGDQRQSHRARDLRSGGDT